MSDRADVDQVTLVRLEGQDGILVDCTLEGLALFEPTRVMSVSVEREAMMRRLEVREDPVAVSGQGRHEIFRQRFARRSMHDLHGLVAVGRELHRRYQGSQPIPDRPVFLEFRIELAPGPIDRTQGTFIETDGILVIQEGGIVVALQADLTSLLHQLADLEGRGAIADDVAETDDGLHPLRIDIAQSGLQGFKVGVEVGEEGDQGDAPGADSLPPRSRVGYSRFPLHLSQPAKIMPLFLLLMALVASLTSPLPAQEEKPQEPLPAGVAAMVDGVEIPMEAYRDFLFQRFGKRPLQQLIDRQVVDAAIKAYDLQIPAEAVEMLVQERKEQAYQGRGEEQFRISLRDGGLNEDLFLAGLRADAKQEIALDALVRATRIPTDARIQKAFEAQYGVGGQRIEVRHVLVMPHFLRAEKVKAGARPQDIDNDAMKAEALARAEECHAKLLEGADFIAMVAEYSHDQVSLRSEGLLPAYRPGLYGKEFTQAVQSLEPGQFSQVLTSGAGYHIVYLESREVTQLAEVREALVESVMTAAPTWQEREELLAGLRAAADIQLW